MVDSFVEMANVLTQQHFPWHRYRLDPALQAYANWLDTQEGDVAEAAIRQKARSYALNTQHSFKAGERHRYFSPFSTSYAEASLQYQADDSIKINDQKTL